MKEEICQFLELNNNADITYQNLWDIIKAVLRGNFTALNAYITINRASPNKPNSTSQGPKKSRTIQNQRQYKKKIINTKPVRLKIKTNTMNQTVLQNSKQTYCQPTNSKGEIIMDVAKIQITDNYFADLYANKLENSEQRFQDIYELPKLNQEDIKTLNNPITGNEIKAVITYQLRKAQVWMNSPLNSTSFREDLIPILLKTFNETVREAIFPKSFLKATFTPRDQFL